MKLAIAIKAWCRWMLGSGLCVLLAMGAQPACATSNDAPIPQADVVRDGDRWTVTYRFDRDAKAWGFKTSNLLRRTRTSWRVGIWEVETPGVRIDRIKGHDAIVADRGTVPRTITVSFPLETRDLLASYDPALVFSSGGVALYSGHFTVFPLDMRAGRLLDIGQPSVRFTDTNETLWVDGKRYSGAHLLGDPRYQLFGPQEPVEGEDSVLLLDNGLPDWLRSQLTEFTPRVMGAYASRLGEPRLAGKPELWATWRGAERDGYSLSGSVLQGHIVMSLSGETLLTPSGEALGGAQWFIAHESAHFWLGQTLGYAEQGDAWITEGGANIAAVNVLVELATGFDAGKELGKYADDCEVDAAAGSMLSAQSRQQFDIYYNCGALFHLAAAKAAKAKGIDWFAFHASVISKYQPQRTISTRQWMSEAADLGVPKTAVAAMLVIHGSDRKSERIEATAVLREYLRDQLPAATASAS